MSNDYQRGVTDLLAEMKIELGWTGFISDRGKAMALGKKLADTFLDEGGGATPDDFLGAPWSEMDKPYPKKVGLALVAKGFDPDREEPRFELLKGFHARLRDRTADSPPA